MVSLPQASNRGKPCIALPAEAHWAGSSLPTGEFMGNLLVINARDRFSGFVRSRRFSSLMALTAA
jgi:hypothetical protein